VRVAAEQALLHRDAVDLLLEPVRQLPLHVSGTHDRRDVLPVKNLHTRHQRRTNSKPKRPFTHRLPRVTSWSSGDVTLTISPSCTCSSRLQPTPQYAQTVVTTRCLLSSHVPAWRMSYSRFDMSAPVGHTAMQLPQYTHADSGSVTSSSVEMCASKPRLATA